MEITSLSLPPLHSGGDVITFYSYKGGTGRTMALSNIAVLLARQRNATAPVLMIDWDLEAPGLHKFFHPFLNSQLLRATPGLINLIDDYRREALRDGDLQHLQQILLVTAGIGGLGLWVAKSPGAVALLQAAGAAFVGWCAVGTVSSRVKCNTVGG
jgi:hypothetical protein